MFSRAGTSLHGARLSFNSKRRQAPAGGPTGTMNSWCIVSQANYTPASTCFSITCKHGYRVCTLFRDKINGITRAREAIRDTWSDVRQFRQAPRLRPTAPGATGCACPLAAMPYCTTPPPRHAKRACPQIGTSPCMHAGNGVLPTFSGGRKFPPKHIHRFSIPTRWLRAAWRRCHSIRG